MTTSGFHWEGLLRALQGDIMALIGFIVILLVVGWIVGQMVKQSAGAGKEMDDDAKNVLKWRKKIIICLILLASFLFAWRAVTFISANRIPRADVDKSSVYDQMNLNIKR